MDAETLSETSCILSITQTMDSVQTGVPIAIQLQSQTLEINISREIKNKYIWNSKLVLSG
jgi:hypothetical protein